MSENEPTFIKPANDLRERRRSSFFQRRLSYHSTDSVASSTPTELNSSGGDEEDKLTNYLKKLENEKDDWNKLFKKTKKENRELKEKCSEVVDDSWKYLTKEDREFLEERPDYASIGRLLDRTTEVVALRRQRIAKTCGKLRCLASDYDNKIASSTEAVIELTMRGFPEFNLLTE